MRRLVQLFALLLFAGLFLAASFIGGMVHSILAELARAHQLWWWLGGALLFVLLWAWYWRRRRRRTADPETTAQT